MLSARAFISTFNFDMGMAWALSVWKRRDPDNSCFHTKAGRTLAVGTRIGYSVFWWKQFLARRWRQHVPFGLLFPQTRFGGVVIHIQVVWFVFTYSSAG